VELFLLFSSLLLNAFLWFSSILNGVAGHGMLSTTLI